LYVPNINQILFNALADILPNLDLSKNSLINQKPSSDIIANAFNKLPNFAIDTSPKSPKDAPKITPQKNDAEDAKQKLLKEVEAKKQAQ